MMAWWYLRHYWTRVPDNTGRWFDNCDCDVVLFDDVEINEILPMLKLTKSYRLEKYSNLLTGIQSKFLKKEGSSHGSQELFSSATTLPTNGGS